MGAKVFDTAEGFVKTFKDEFPKINSPKRVPQYKKAVENLTRIWSRCGNDSDGVAVQKELERGLSNNVCKAIGQVTTKFLSWTNTYLDTCPNKKRNNPLAKFPRMEKNMLKAAGCNKKEDED